MKIRQKAIICDIDGCLLDSSKVLEEAELNTNSANDKWGYFDKYANDFSKVYFNENLGGLLASMFRNGYKIIFSTARSVAIRTDTQIRLRSELGFNFSLFMRSLDDKREAHKVKQEHLNIIQKFYDVRMAIDDEDANLEMFARNGIFVMKAI